MDIKNDYRQWCEQENVPLFLQPWWLDAALQPQKSWMVLLDKQAGKITASLVLHQHKKYGLKMVLMPELTPYGGFWFASSLTEIQKEEACQRLFQQLLLQKNHYVQLCLHYRIDVGKKAKEFGFKVVQRPSYRIEDISDSQAVFDSFHHSKQRHIRRSEKTLTARFDLSVEEFASLHALQYQLQNKNDFYTKQRITTICQTAIDRNQGAIVAIEDATKTIQAALFAVWDEQSAYNLLYFIHPQYRASGASSMMVFEMIKHLKNKTLAFDFEGGTQPAVAASYQLFGTKKIEYLYLQKFKSKAIQWLFQIFMGH